MGWLLLRCGVVVLTLMAARSADAQSRVDLRGFADIGTTAFAATRSFETVLGSARGTVWGGGVEAVLPRGVFVSARASRLRRHGERVFLFNDQRFPLGIPVTVTITPVELAGGYRFDARAFLIPYGGGGIGWYGFDETSRFAEAMENVRGRALGYHAVGGAELRLTRSLGTAFEAGWARVPDGLPRHPDSVSQEFGESDLGGVTLRIKIVVGR